MQEKKHFGMMWHGQGGRILLIAAVKLVGGLILFFPYEARPDEVLREPPKLYSEQLAPLLTPKEQVLKTDQKSLEANVAGITLLDEAIISVDESGRRTCVFQVFHKALTDAGAHGIAEETFIFRKKDQRFFFVLAESIQPDGSVQSVAPNAVLVQSPQRGQQYSLYDDQAEVRIIYPNVKPGSITHAIVVREDLQTRMPGEFSQVLTWNATWPIGQIRYLVDVPADLDKRLHIHTLGNNVPVTVREDRPDRRVRYTAIKNRIGPVRDEVNPAPANQIGPCLNFSTVADWEAVGRWYGGLLQGRDHLSASLAAQVDDWTKGVETPGAVLRVLLAKVANDVRYVGLELGEADYQPHDCNEVWTNQYGDCKDKANLLTAFLHHKGIAARVVLLNAEHAGLIDRRNPGYQAFNHAIVAIPEEKGYLYCDPTLAYASPGMISPTDADRDVFIITDSSGQWERTPLQSAGKLDYRFDLTMKPTGELAGWLVLTGDRFYGAAQQDYYQKLDANEARRQLGELLRSFYPGAEVIDVVNRSAQDASQLYTLKAYFLVPRRLESGAGRQTLTFPQTNGLFWSMGYSPERDSPYFMYRGHVSVSCTVALPSDLVPGDLPAPYAVATVAGTIRGEWRAEKSACRMELHMETTRSQLSPPDFAGYYGAIQALRAWLDKPIELSTSESTAAPASDLAVEDFPLMPTGAGQLALLEKRFPQGGNPTQRRAALEKILQYFPSDKETVFQAGVYLSELDWEAGRKQDAALRLQLLVAAYKSELQPNIFAFGEMIYGTILHRLDRDQEAQEIFVRIANSTGLTDQLRAQAALTGADILRKTAPDRALELLAGAVALPSSIRPEACALMAYILLQQDKATSVRQRVAEVIAAHPAEAEDLLCRVAKSSGDWTAQGDDQRQQTLLAILAESMPQASAALRQAIATAKARRESGQVYGRIQGRLKDAIARPPLSSWYQPDGDQSLTSDEELSLAIKAAEQNGKADRCLELAVQALLVLPPDGHFPLRLGRAAIYADWTERRAGQALDQPIQLLLFDCCDELSAEEDNYYWGRLLRAQHLGRKGDYAGEQSIYRTMLENSGLIEVVKPAVYGYLGASLEKTGDFEQALDAYAGLVKHPSVSPERASWLLRAAFINLHLNRTEPAIRILEILEATDEATMRRTEGAAQIRELIALHRSGKAMEFWARQNRWWMAWQALVKKMELPPAGVETVVPLIVSRNDWGIALDGAMKANDRLQFLQELRKGISAARWLPNISVDAAGLLALLARIAPEAVSDYRHLVISILEQAQDMYNAPETLWGGPLMLAANYYDDGQPGKALEIIASLRKIPQSNGDSLRAMHRLWGLAAYSTRHGMEESAAALSKDLEDPNVVPARADLVGLLVELDWALCRISDKDALLKRELANPVIQKDARGFRMLTAQNQAFKAANSVANQSFNLPDLRIDVDLSAPTRGYGQTNAHADVLPKPILQKMPLYPQEMAKRKLHGKVIVLFVVDATGAVTDAHAMGKPNAELAALAVAAVSKWKFEPGRKRGQRVGYHMQVPIEF